MEEPGSRSYRRSMSLHTPSPIRDPRTTGSRAERAVIAAFPGSSGAYAVAKRRPGRRVERVSHPDVGDAGGIWVVATAVAAVALVALVCRLLLG